MYNQNQHRHCNEFYTVAKTIEVVVLINGEQCHIRIDALKDETQGVYTTHSYFEENVTLQPTYPNSGGLFQRPTQDYQIWTSFNLPWTRSDTADGALNQALGWLSERCDKPDI
ncbi:hypothetical protein [Terasakiella pusilla]|uniref:hypothetical protein n=1 Tax=Terasakiella pusilla TaxID=64973 RepID=UPI003AA966DC